MPTLTVRRQASVNGTSYVDKSLDFSGSLLTLIDGEAIAGSATTQFIVTLDVSAVTGFMIVSTVSCTLKTNDTGSPANTIALRANEPYIFNTNDYNTFLLTTDVTSMYFVVAGATAGTVTLAAVVDPTP